MKYLNLIQYMGYFYRIGKMNLDDYLTFIENVLALDPTGGIHKPHNQKGVPA